MFKNNYLRDAIYSTRINAASAENLLDILESCINTKKKYKSSDFYNNLKKVISNVDSGKWLEKAISTDIPSIEDVMQNLIKEEMDIEKTLKKDLKSYIQALNRMRIRFQAPELYLMKEFPWPYERIDGWAVNIDYVDEKEFGVPRGIYLHEKYLARRFSTTILAHELIHCAIAENRGMDHVRGIEEGIAEIIGLALSSKQIGWDAAENVLFNSRFEWPIEDFWANYQVSIRQAGLIFLQGGIKDLAELVLKAQQKGRKQLYSSEIATLQGLRPNKITSFKRTRLTKTILRFLAYPQSLVVSPLAFLVASIAHKGDSADKLANRLRASTEEIEEALKELQDRHYIVLVVDGRVLSTGGRDLINSCALRYEIPEV